MSRAVVNPLGTACSLKNETAVDIAEMEMESMRQQYEKEHPDGVQFVPSDEDSVSNHQDESSFLPDFSMQYFIYSSHF